MTKHAESRTEGSRRDLDLGRRAASSRGWVWGECALYVPLGFDPETGASCEFEAVRHGEGPPIGEAGQSLVVRDAATLGLPIEAFRGAYGSREASVSWDGRSGWDAFVPTRDGDAAIVGRGLDEVEATVDAPERAPTRRRPGSPGARLLIGKLADGPRLRPLPRPGRTRTGTSTTRTRRGRTARTTDGGTGTVGPRPGRPRERRATGARTPRRARPSVEALARRPGRGPSAEGRRRGAGTGRVGAARRGRRGAAPRRWE